MSQLNAIRVLVVDDHPVVRQGLVAMLEEAPDILVVGQAGNGQEAIAVFRQKQPDATLMDLRMPQMDGVAAITAICTEFPAARIIVLTTYEGDEDIYQGLRAGAKGYLLKDAEPEELLFAIHAVHKGHKHIPPRVGAKLLERMASPELSDRELEVLQLITTGKSTQAISKALYITERTVNFHINHILSKLGVEDRTQAVIVALRRGIVSL
ncbi:response regulator transcription factor [Nostoc flagelliforme FACHB-838]|uniref:Response regulator transcription factor n=1 Tax=Nostoc flagelliforme FACHB-838 TaxID=2692904 RepID=A0ABR8DXM7_9NOSO|nr:response regulator transcription factor [Nostoc flagelliforme]MBD2534181.1 response regulator transcription factor [Nostoc flagelliforme FACHB-838]